MWVGARSRGRRIPGTVIGEILTYLRATRRLGMVGLRSTNTSSANLERKRKPRLHVERPQADQEDQRRHDDQRRNHKPAAPRRMEERKGNCCETIQKDQRDGRC